MVIKMIKMNGMTMFAKLIFFSLWTFVSSVPFRLNIIPKGVECMWDKLSEGDSATISVFILEGSQLKATLVVEGPFAEEDVEVTKDLVAAEQKFVTEGHRWTQHTLYEEIVDFEHIQIPFEDEEEEEEVYDDDDDETVPAEEQLEETQKRIQERRNRRAVARRRAQQQRRKKVQLENERRKLLTDKIKSEGEPHQKTIQAKATGWYRGCVAATFDKLVVELEFRTSKELGGIDPATSHVFSYAKRKEMEEEGLLDADTADGEPDIKAEDFSKVRDQVRELRRVLNQVTVLQQTSKNRMSQHEQMGKTSHSKMTQNSILMTILFIAVTAFQVFTIQRWFSSGNASLLAR